MVSIIIPCFNRSHLIGRTVASALCQSYQDFEVVVVNDASLDVAELTQVLQSFGDPRIRLIHHDKNRGGGAARNTGVREAKGEHIAFLDSDDEWLPQKLEKQMALAATLPDGPWLIYTQSEVRTHQRPEDPGRVMPLLGIRENELVGDYLFAGRGWLPTPAMLLPRSLAKEVPFNPDLRRHQDYDFLLRLEAVHCEFRMVPEPLVVVHWEDLHESARGLNPERSMDFLRAYAGYLTPKARSGFINTQIVGLLLGARRRWEALSYLRFVRPWHLPAIAHVGLWSGFLFGDARLAVCGAKVKQVLRRGSP